jgi:hypothetical protein
MVLSNSKLLTAAALLGPVLLGSLPALASAQEPEANPCVVRKEPSGLIRGDRVPAGCVLQSEETPPGDERSDWPVIVCEETFFHTPLPKKSVLTNCVALSRGRMLIPTVPPSDGKLGSLERHFGPVERHLGPVERHFGPLERHFGPSRSTGPVDRDTPKR